MAQELEYKFALVGEPPEEGALAALLRPAGLTLERRALRRQRDRYFDSAEGALARAGLALRLRRVAGRRLATLKGASLKGASERHGALHIRDELELPFAGAWPAEIRAALRGHADPAALEPVLDIATERRPYLVGQLAGDAPTGALAELVFDRVRARRPASSAGEGRPREVAFGEVELEALAADAEALQQLAELLQRGLALNASTPNKLERALIALAARGGSGVRLRLALIRHAKAEVRGPRHPDDRLRPLTSAGEAQAAALARALAGLDEGFDRLFASPYRRAWQTAEALAPRAPRGPEPLEALAGDDYAALLAQLQAALEVAETRVALVGHEPFLGELASLLLCGDRFGARVRFKKGALLTLSGELAVGSMALEGLLSPARYRRLR